MATKDQTEAKFSLAKLGTSKLTGEPKWRYLLRWREETLTARAASERVALGE
jgi:hypothetical protein